MSSFFDDVESSQKEQYFKVKEGQNTIRIVGEPKKFLSRFKQGICYEGAPYCQMDSLDENEALTLRFKTWIIDRKDGVMKLYDFPNVVAKALKTLKDDPDYAFDGFPMPYDITITAENAGTKEVKYTVLPRKESPLTDEEVEILKTKTPAAEIVAKYQEKAKKEYESKNAIQLDEPVTPDDIPF